MRVVFPPFVNLEAEFTDVKALGRVSVSMEFTVRGKHATITMSFDEAKQLFEGLKVVGVGQPAIELPKITLPKK
jgi:hypothetical protein